jgi:hypothetical protein
MKKELPDMIFDEIYDNFYLFTEFDIIFNEEFYKKLLFFIKKIGNKRLLFKSENSLNLLVPLDFKFEYLNPNIDNLKQFYEMEILSNEKKIQVFCINHFISDESSQWELYVSLRNELCIFSCNNSIKPDFISIINPYQEITLKNTYKIIGDRFNDKKARETFLNSLERNYNFSVAPVRLNVSE